MINRRFGAVLVAAASIVLCASPARADYVVKDGNGAFQTMRSIISGLIHHPLHVMEGLFGGTPTPVNMTNSGALDVTIVGGGTGGGAVTNAGTFAVQVSNTPTVNLGALNGAATAAAQASLLTAVGSPLQAGGSIGNITGTVSLPTGAATAANQATANTSLSTIAANTTGIATSALQTTGNTSLGSILTGIGAPADAAWTTGSGSEIALLKAMATSLADTTTESPTKTADGSNVSLGAKADSVCGTDTGTCSQIALAKRGNQDLTTLNTTLSSCTLKGVQTAASTNADFAKASAATLCGGLAVNTTATVYYLRLYNLTAAPTCSSATGFVTTIPIPASTAGNGTVIDLGPFGGAFTTGLAYCVTGGGTSTDATNAAVGVFITLAYK